MVVPSVPRLLAIIELQRDLAAARAELRQVMQLVVDRAATLTNAEGAVVEVLEGDELVYRAATESMRDHLGTRLPRTSSLTGRCIDEARTLRTNDALDDARCDHALCRRLGIASMIVVPLINRVDCVGVLKVMSPAKRAFTGEDALTLELLAGVIASSMRHAQAYEEVRYESLHDPLTGLPNRRAFMERLNEELARHQRYGRPLSLAIVDLDGFKRVNDTLGHAAGDDVLREIAQLLKQQLRTTDFAFRIGGDEFALLMPETQEADAQVAIARCVAAVQCSGLGGGVVGMSAGLVEAADDDAATLTRRADARMYEHKRSRKEPNAVLLKPFDALEVAAA